MRESEGGTTIIALTADAKKEECDKALRLGMADYITKPFSKKSLLETVKKWVQNDSVL